MRRVDRRVSGDAWERLDIILAFLLFATGCKEAAASDRNVVPGAGRNTSYARLSRKGDTVCQAPPPKDQEPSPYRNSRRAFLPSSVVNNVSDAQWAFTLTRNGTPVTELTEGGDAATATISITNGVTFDVPQTMTLKWGEGDLTTLSFIGEGGETTITILAGTSSGSLVISAPQRPDPQLYYPEESLPLTALREGSIIGSIDVTRLEDDPVPVMSVTQAPTTVSEGDGIDIEIGFSIGFLNPGRIEFTVSDPDNAIVGTPPSARILAAGDTAEDVGMHTAENMVQTMAHA